MDKKIMVENDSTKELFFDIGLKIENEKNHDINYTGVTVNGPNLSLNSCNKYVNYFRDIEYFTHQTLPNFKYNETENHINQLKKCSEKLIGITQLENNWNENGAEKFSYKLIVKCYSILVGLPFLPEIFPVADGSIQFEYEKKDGSYLEFNIFEDDISEFLSYPNEKEIEKNVSIDKIPEEVKKFYERPDK